MGVSIAMWLPQKRWFFWWKVPSRNGWLEGPPMTQEISKYSGSMTCWIHRIPIFSNITDSSCVIAWRLQIGLKFVRGCNLTLLHSGQTCRLELSAYLAFPSLAAPLEMHDQDGYTLQIDVYNRPISLQRRKAWCTHGSVSKFGIPYLNLLWDSNLCFLLSGKIPTVWSSSFPSAQVSGRTARGFHRGQCLSVFLGCVPGCQNTHDL